MCCRRLSVLSNHVIAPACRGAEYMAGSVVSSAPVVEDAAYYHRRAVSEGVAVEVDTGSPTVLARVQSRVGVIILNKPERRNSLGDDLSPFLRGAIHKFAIDERVRCVLLTGAGAAFCSGGNVVAMAGNSKDQPVHKPPAITRTDWTGLPMVPVGIPSDANLLTKMSTMTGALWAMEKPTIAVLPGPAAGAGLSIALAADLRIFGRSAFVTTGFRNIGLPGDYGTSWLLPQLVGPAKAKQLLFTSERVNSEECLRLGIAQEVFDDAELHRRAFEFAAHVAAGPPHALRAFKLNVQDAITGDFRAGLETEAIRFAEFYRNPDAVANFREAATAFVEKRAPRFK